MERAADETQSFRGRGADHSRDRIGDVVRELPRKARAAPLPAIDEAALIDLRSTIDAIITMLRYRVERLAAVVAVM